MSTWNVESSVKKEEEFSRRSDKTIHKDFQNDGIN